MSSRRSLPLFSDGGGEAESAAAAPQPPSGPALKKLRCNMAREGAPGESSRRSARHGPCPRAQRAPPRPAPASRARDPAVCTRLPARGGEGIPPHPPPGGRDLARLQAGTEPPAPANAGLPCPRGPGTFPSPRRDRAGPRERPAPLPAEAPARHLRCSPRRKGGGAPAFRLYRAGGRKRRGDNPRSAFAPAGSPCWAGGRRAGSGRGEGPGHGARTRDGDGDGDGDPRPRPLPDAGPDPQRYRTALSPPTETQGMLGAGFPSSGLHPPVPPPRGGGRGWTLGQSGDPPTL